MQTSSETHIVTAPQREGRTQNPQLRSHFKELKETSIRTSIADFVLVFSFFD